MRFLTRLLRTITTAGGVGLLLWLMRDRMVRLPMRQGERLPVFRSAPPAHAPPAAEVTAIVGIGPVYAERLAAAGITNVTELAHASADSLSKSAEVSRSLATEWIVRASEMSHNT